MAGRFCEKCGTQVGEDSKFCPSCGSKINQVHIVGAEEVESDAKNNKTNDIVVREGTQYVVSDGGIVLQSAAPITSKTGWAKWAYIAGLLAGFFNVGTTVLVFVVVFIIEHIMMRYYSGKLRDMKFKFVSPVSVDEIFDKLQPALSKKYGSKIDFEREGEIISVLYDDIYYDINLAEDGTVGIWWRRSVLGAMFSFNEWKQYRKVRTGTALVAYELQQQFGIR